MPITAEQLEVAIAELGERVGRSLHAGFGAERVGFALLLFDFGDKGSMCYCSNSNREDMIRSLAELLAKLRAAPREA